MDLNSTVPINYTFFEVCLHSWYKIHFMEGDEIVTTTWGTLALCEPSIFYASSFWHHCWGLVVEFSTSLIFLKPNSFIYRNYFIIYLIFCYLFLFYSFISHCT